MCMSMLASPPQTASNDMSFNSTSFAFCALKLVQNICGNNKLISTCLKKQHETTKNKEPGGAWWSWTAVTPSSEQLLLIPALHEPHRTAFCDHRTKVLGRLACTAEHVPSSHWSLWLHIVTPKTTGKYNLSENGIDFLSFRGCAEML
jgi:hypothetical protein